MMKLEIAHIEEVRGIRKLDIDFRKGTFAISGPNGSGMPSVMFANGNLGLRLSSLKRSIWT